MFLVKHVDCIDVAMVVKKRFFIREKNGFKCKIDWFNISNPENIYRICADKVFIRADDMKNWKVFKK
jgi:hypothetical protein